MRYPWNLGADAQLMVDGFDASGSYVSLGLLFSEVVQDL